MRLFAMLFVLVAGCTTPTPAPVTTTPVDAVRVSKPVDATVVTDAAPPVKADAQVVVVDAGVVVLDAAKSVETSL